MDEGQWGVYTDADDVSEQSQMGRQTKGHTAKTHTTKLDLSGIFRVADIIDDLRDIYKSGLDQGESTGWLKFDSLYRIKKGMMTVVTGIPSSGKSEFVDALATNLAIVKRWKFAVFSPENYPISLHVIKIAEKFIGKQYKSQFEQLSMNRGEIKDAIAFCGDHFTWIYPDDEREKVNLETILRKTSVIIEQTGLDGLIIDPWNEIESDRNGKSETDYISECLTKIRRFARKHSIHIWIIAHPQKMQKNKFGSYDPPTPYDISGSAHWRNKADFCICVHRANLLENKVDVYLQKVKFKHLGKPGSFQFNYDWMSGRFSEAAQC